MTMTPSLPPGNLNKIDLCILSSSLILKPVIDCHHLAHPFQKSLLLLQSIRKCAFVLMLLQYEQMLSVFIFMCFSHMVVWNLAGLLLWGDCQDTLTKLYTLDSNEWSVCNCTYRNKELAED